MSFGTGEFDDEPNYYKDTDLKWVKGSRKPTEKLEIRTSIDSPVAPGHPLFPWGDPKAGMYWMDHIRGDMSQRMASKYHGQEIWRAHPTKRARFAPSFVNADRWADKTWGRETTILSVQDQTKDKYTWQGGLADLRELLKDRAKTPVLTAKLNCSNGTSPHARTHLNPLLELNMTETTNDWLKHQSPMTLLLQFPFYFSVGMYAPMPVCSEWMTYAPQNPGADEFQMTDMTDPTMLETPRVRDCPHTDADILGNRLAESYKGTAMLIPGVCLLWRKTKRVALVQKINGNRFEPNPLPKGTFNLKQWWDVFASEGEEFLDSRLEKAKDDKVFDLSVFLSVAGRLLRPAADADWGSGRVECDIVVKRTMPEPELSETLACL